jgi:hypothetical protein
VYHNLLRLLPKPAPQGISFCDVLFSEPVRLDFALRAKASGIYAILVPDSTSSPRPYRAIYFGQVEDFSTRLSGTTHEKYSSWCREAGNWSNLYVSFHFMFLSNEAARCAVERRLIRDYSPACNIQGNDGFDNLYRTLFGV